eukprot:scaffold178760_cov27-Prasinocladus_malaysianus.AAC.1
MTWTPLTSLRTPWSSLPNNKPAEREYPRASQMCHQSGRAQGGRDALTLPSLQLLVRRRPAFRFRLLLRAALESLGPFACPRLPWCLSPPLGTSPGSPRAPATPARPIVFQHSEAMC